MSELHVRVDGSGRDVVLLHGWGFHSGAWSGIAEALAARYRVRRVDLPGHGLSAAPPPAHFDAAADEVARCIPAGSVVAGWSLGGLFAQRIAARSPGQLAGLLLVSTTPCFVARGDWADAMAAATLEGFARELEADPARTMEQFVHLNVLGGARPRETARAFLQRLREVPSPAPAALRTGLHWLQRTDLRSSAAEISTRCVVLHGARDRVTPAGAGRWLAREIPGAEMIEVEDAAHLPFATHPQRFIEAVERVHG